MWQFSQTVGNSWPVEQAEERGTKMQDERDREREREREREEIDREQNTSENYSL